MNSCNRNASIDQAVMLERPGGSRVGFARLAYLVASAFLAVAPSVHAAPASPATFTLQQPNGTIFSANVRGDEFQNWTETVGGYTVIKNPATGVFEYAVPNAVGLPILSGVTVVPDGASVNVPENLWPPKHLKPARNVEMEKFQENALNTARTKRFGSGAAFTSPTGTWAPTPVSGAKKILLVLVNFTDATLQPGAATYWGNVVHSTTTPSVVKYYQDNSFGTVAVTPVTSTQGGSPNGVVSVTLAQNHPNCGGSCSYSVESAWINSALAAAAPYVNFAALDTNSNGTISVDEALVYFVLAGYEAAAGSSTPSIWAHAWGGPGVTVAGKAINHWALNGERYNASTLMTMGVVTHEMGHAMGGLPDLYDISGTNGGLGIFSLMSSGSWGAKSGEVGGTTPVGMDGWSRQYLGWSTPQEPINGALVSFSSPLSSPSASVMMMNSAVSTSEYWLVENRSPVGWDAGMYTTLGPWSGGLLIQHIDTNIGSKSANSFNKYVAGSHQGNMAVEPSTKACTLVTPPGSWGGCLTLMYYAGNSTTFNAGSTPPSNYYSGALSSVGVTNVSAPASTMTANIQMPTAGSTFALSVSRTGSGRVTSADSNIDCGTVCSASYVSGTSVVLTATASPGASFTGWSGACSGTSTCNVTMSVARSVTANFTSVADFPAGGVMPVGWVQPAGSNAAWGSTTDSTFSGTYGLRAGAIGDSQASRVSYTGTFVAGNVTFARRVSSESGYDFLTFYIDGVAQGSWSGEVPWSIVSYAITAGTHTIMWEYSKDEGVAGGSDTAWVDEVSLPLAVSSGTSAPWLDLLLLLN